MALFRDQGARLKSVYGGTKVAAIKAQGTLAPANLTGEGVDREGFQSAVILFNAAFVALTDADTLAVTPKVEHSSDNSNWEDFQTMALSTITAVSEDELYTGLRQVDLNLEKAKKYIRGSVTLASAAGNLSCCSIVAVLGGAYELPTEVERDTQKDYFTS